ncbi:MAG: Dabb family protein [Nitrospinae bacterium]|nr:Dabb family protein [Nitrospinota bacterium]
MIKHIVMWKIKGMNEEDKCNNCKQLIKMLEGLKHVIPEIQEIEAGLDFSKTDASYDVALYSSFESQENLEKYKIHPEHVKVAEFLKGIALERKVVDYEC